MPKIIDEDHVFKAVLECLVARGYDRATTSELAAAANIHEATLFRKYGSKVGLIEQAIEHQLSKSPLSKVTYTGDLEGDLYAILNAYLATHAKHGDIIPMLILEIPRYAELRNVLETPLANIQNLVNILARYQDQGRLQPEPALLSLNALLAPVLMNEMFRQVQQEFPPVSIDLHKYVEGFLYGRKK
jgi:AcrR family transcriptional regulator